jgi:Uncharacterized conserved protein
MKRKGILIVGHGSKSSDAVREFEQMVAYTSSQTEEFVVKGAHMELAEPNIPETVEALVAGGVTDIRVLPYFLYTGNHIKQDIPEILAEVKQNYPNVKFSFGKALGFDPRIADILLAKADEVVGI